MQNFYAATGLEPTTLIGLQGKYLTDQAKKAPIDIFCELRRVFSELCMQDPTLTTCPRFVLHVLYQRPRLAPSA